MKEVLSSLELLFVKRDRHEWPVSLATLIVVLMTVESIQYHAAKLPYHISDVTQMKQEDSIIIHDEAVKSLLNFYAACFPECHAKLKPGWDGITPEDKFIQSVQEAISSTTQSGYLESKATAVRAGDNMEFFFDRLVARLLLLEV
jgi:hypothetical protein